MSDYKYRGYKKKKRNRREKVGFYTALSICLVAVCMAVYSTYNTLTTEDIISASHEESTDFQQVEKKVTGIVETIAAPQSEAEIPTVPQQSATQGVTEPTDSSSKTALETMLSTNLSLTYPLNTNNVIHEFSEKSVYFKTLNVWKPHTGIDFAGELGDDISSMSSGAVTKVYNDKMYGKTVEISFNDAVCIYNGMGAITVKEGDSVEAGSKIGVLGTVPCEASEKNHLHVAVKIGGKYVDPLTFINNNQ